MQRKRGELGTKLKTKLKATDRTRMIHGKTSTQAWDFSHHLIPPITSNTTFRLGSLKRGAEGFVNFATGEHLASDPTILIYDRLDEPNTMMLEEQLALMEKAECAVTFASGMGAISSALLSVLRSGQKIIAHRTLYGCTYSLLNDWLPRFGIKTTFVDVNSDSHRQLFNDPKVRVVYFESLTNPTLEVSNLPAILNEIQAINSKRKPADRIITIVDNTFATPWGLRPIEWGVDMVVESLTKNISGFGTEMGGAVMTRKEFEIGLKLARKDFGAILNPKAAWQITVHGIPTLAIRFEQQQKNAMDVAQFLERHKNIEKVIYPGLLSHPQHKLAKKLLKTPEGNFAPGTMIAFIVRGNMSQCQKFVDTIANRSYSITLAVSLGLTKTLIEVPGFMTHAAIPREKQGISGIDARLVRLSLGIENSVDIISDLDMALSLLKN
jgi:methionine-gamma-lyase